MTRQVLVPLELSPVQPPQGAVRTLRGLTMGTSWTVRIVASDAAPIDRLGAGIQRQLDRVVDQMSTWEPGSALSRFNATVGEWRTLPFELFTVLDHALALAEESGGAYDPTTGPLVNLWGFGPEGSRRDPPDRQAILTTRARIGWNRIELDRATGRARQPGGCYVDLSGIAKGYAVDLVGDWLREQGISDFLVEVGGELLGAGVKPNGQPWWVALEAPPGAGAIPESLVALHGLSAATSGDYRKFFESDGLRFSHTLDPRTGHPVANGLASVTVLHPRCMLADAMATALTVMGPREGFDFARARGIAARFLVRTADNFHQRMTPALAAMLD
ncbi:FAD:protein FMN transferase [Iodidimonas sp. SYSU 1G8]|uniref:FAD:protein FMN transferase n=1 Tax=Iodidimonas sp. SYSU 1G8 TaxID=3133967 RepID=UPI0031FEA754